MGVMRFDLKEGESLTFDEGRILVTIEHKTGSRARLKVKADDSIIVGVDRPDEVAVFKKPAKY